jgi:vacuolar-type H+-ATPase subunit E/Vma4
MEPTEKGKDELISGLQSDARAEEEQIIKEAEKQAAEKRKYAEKKIEAVLKDAEREAQKRAEAVRRKALSAVELELKRHALANRSAIVRDITERVEKKLVSMTGDENYKSVLRNWIVEAFIGLGADSAEINASKNERELIDEQLLSQAAERIHDQTGKQAQLKLSDDQPLKSQGVILTASNGHTAFNNQVKTRMLRKQREIRKLINDSIFTGNQE